MTQKKHIVIKPVVEIKIVHPQEDDWTKDRVCPKCGEPLEADWMWASDYLPIESDFDDWKAWHLVCDSCGINYVDKDGTLEEC